MKRLSYSRLITKLGISFSKIVNPRDFETLTKTERECVLIFNTLVKHHNSKLYIGSLYDKYYIKSKDTGIFITLSKKNSEISIINHVYGYNVKLSPRSLKGMVNLFSNEIDKRINQMEEDYTNNIQHSLHHITKTIKKRID